MKHIIDILGKYASFKDESDQESADFQDILDDAIRSLRRRFSLRQTSNENIKTRKEALYEYYSRQSSAMPKSSNYRRRHTTAGLNASVTDFLIDRDLQQKTGSQNKNSLIEVAKNTIFSHTKGKKESVSEAVSRNVAARKKEMKKLTRSQTVAVIRTKYSLDKTDS